MLYIKYLKKDFESFKIKTIYSESKFDVFRIFIFRIFELYYWIKVLSKLNDSPSHIKKPSKSDFKLQLSKIESGIHSKEKELRQNLIDAYDLQEENYPNSNILIQGLGNLLFNIFFNFYFQV